MLRLLDIKGDVKAVKVEGPPRDEIHLELGEHGQAADITLVRDTGGAPTYRYLQLKHSASNPTNNWSWSRLLTRRAKTKPLSSVLGKLAGLLKAVQFKGDFSIVTNQPLSATVAADIARLIGNDNKSGTKDAALLGKLTRGLGLSPQEVVTFLRAWDLTGFSSTSRLVMESEVILHLANMTDADARDDANLLQKRIATLMLPESRNDPAVTREVLLVWLGIGSEGMLFPAPSQINVAKPYLRRAVIGFLGEKLAAPQLKPLRLHAGGGSGKTSLICDLPSVLPPGSEMFLYDCYGGGLFLASDQKRHLPEQAFTQLGNEIAARLRTPMVMRRQGSIDAFEAFRNRVMMAAGLLEHRSPDAQLVLCFDAVDNARTGARHWQEPCFLDALSQASTWPNNVRILVSCRTARRDEVGGKHLYEDFEVLSFDVNEVRQLVSLWQPEWRPELATTFESLTGGNPRRLVYAIKGMPRDGEMQAIERLMPKAEGINPLFEQRVIEAGKHLGNANKVWQVLDALSRLPRPVPAHILATLADLAPADISDIAVDVGGIVERKEGWSFHDEDFEAFVIERPGCDGKALLARAADLFLEARFTDRYAATSVAEVLANADRLKALYALVTQEERQSTVLTPLEEQFVWSRRLGLAIRCCRTASDITNACSLLIASADAIRRTELLEDLTVENLDLSVRFATEEANRLAMVSQRHRIKRPRLRIELACQAATTHPETAKMHLQWWYAHLRELREPEGPNHFKVNERDIAAEYQVNSALFGEKQAFTRLFSWRPKSALKTVFLILAAEAAGRNCHALLEAINARAWPPIGLAPLMAAALLSGADISDPVMRSGLARLGRATRARWSAAIDTGLSNSPPLAWHEAVLLVCERAIAHDDLKPLVVQVLDHALPKPELEETHHLYRLRSAGARHARAYALRELISEIVVPVDEWLPPRRKETQHESIGSKLRQRQEKSPEQRWNEALSETATEFSRFVKAARVTLASITSDPIVAWPALAVALDVSRSFTQSSLRDPDVATLLMRNHLVHAGISGENVTSLVSGMRKVLQAWKADDITRAQDLAKTLALMPQTHDAALGLLTEVAGKIETDPLPASDRVNFFSKSARIALPIDAGLAEYFFRKAVEATASVDFEARSALAAAGAIAHTGLGGSTAECAASAARLGDAAGAVVASLGIEGEFAWDEVIGWVTAANLPMGLAAASRWHDRGVVSFDNSLPKLMATAPALSLAQRIALATLASDGPIDLDTAVAHSSVLPNWIVEPSLVAQLREGEVDAFLTVFETLEGRSEIDASTAINTVRAFHDTLVQWKNKGDQDPLASCDRTEDTSNIEASELLQTVGEIRAALEPRPGDRGPDTYQLCQVAKRLGSLALRVPFLEIAVELGAHGGELGEAVPQILEHWSIYPPVTTWMRDRFPSYITGALRSLFFWRYDETETLEAALAATGLAPAAQADVLLAGIERQGERNSAGFLYALTGLIAARTPLENRSDLFDALLSRLEARTTHPPRVPLDNISPPQDIPECVARTLFSAMGDMDRRVRWRACHAALALLRGRDPAWEILVLNLANDEEPIFTTAPFYRYAALEQLMVVLQRAAAENAKDIARHAPLILETIRRESHVIVRELGRSILLMVAGAGAWQLTEEEHTFVEHLNRSKLTSINRRLRSTYRVNKKEKQARNYCFDDTDAIPYWYHPVAQLFDMHIDAFLDRLEHWIHDRWGYGETTTHWVHEPRIDRLQGLHGLTSRRHGACPTVERLSHHIEWHAMMCALGELISEQPICDHEDDNALEAWIEAHLPTLSPYWLSDIRTAPPFEPRFWGFPPTNLPNLGGNEEEREVEARVWGRSVTPEVFDAEINASNDLVVAASFELYWKDVIQRVRIHSALVSPTTAPALAQALANTRDRMDFALPEGGYHEDIEWSGFRLEAWLKTSNSDPKADRFDERRGTVSGFPIESVGMAMSEQVAIGSGYGSCQSQTHDAAIKIEQWGREDNANGHGWRATTSRAYLSDVLQRKERSLIFLVEISRQVRDDDIDRSRTRWLLYVFDGKGVLTRVEREQRSLGRVLVRREGLDKSVDTLGRWILHRAAELTKRRETADTKLGSMLDREIERLCAFFQRRST